MHSYDIVRTLMLPPLFSPVLMIVNECQAMFRITQFPFSGATSWLRFTIYMLAFFLASSTASNGSEPIGWNGVSGSFESHLVSLRKLPPQTVEQSNERAKASLGDIDKAITARNRKIGSIFIKIQFDQYASLISQALLR